MRVNYLKLVYNKISYMYSRALTLKGKYHRILTFYRENGATTPSPSNSITLERQEKEIN